MRWLWIAWAGCAPAGRPHERPDAVVGPPDAPIPADPCPGVSPLDWMDGVDPGDDGVVDEVVVAPGDGWSLDFSGGPYHDQPAIGWSSASLDVERDGRVDWFFASNTGSSYPREPSDLDGLFRIDDVRTTCSRDLGAGAPFLSLPGLAGVDPWEDTTGDGVPELLVTAQRRDVGGDPEDLDFYLVDPTTTDRSGSIAYLAIGHVAVGHGDAGTVGDFDGDGRPEVVYADLERDVLVFLGAIPEEGEPIEPDAEVATPDDVDWLGYTLAGDLDGDGSDDLAITYFEHGTFVGEEYAVGTYYKRVLYGGAGLGAVALDQAFEVDVPYTPCVLVADFDGDGTDDLATGCTNSSRGGVFPFQLDIRLGGPMGIGATADLSVTLPPRALSAAAGDVDGGGVADVLLGSIYLQDDSGTQGPVYLRAQHSVLFRGEDGFAAPALVANVEDGSIGYAPGGYATWGPLVDVDLDGYADILARDLQVRRADGGFADDISMDVLWGEALP